MNKLRQINAQTQQQNYMINQIINKSPFKRHNIHHNQTHLAERSPIRSRTPQNHRNRNHQNALFPTHIKYISNVPPNQPNTHHPSFTMQSSNGQSIKYFKNIQYQQNQSNQKKEAKLEFSKKTDKNLQDQNRLFGKIVDKLNSQKKNGLKSNENSQKTSVFGQTSQIKSHKKDQTQKRPEGALKNIINNVNEIQPKYFPVKKQSKSKKKANQVADFEQQNLSCLVYTIKNVQMTQKQQFSAKKSEKKDEQIGRQPVQNKMVVRKPSRLLNDEEEQEGRGKAEREDKLLNALLQKIQSGLKGEMNSRHCNDDEVKMSMDLMKSLSMEPFI